MNEHSRAQELAATAIDFALEAGERDELDRHLKGCPDCRVVAEQLAEFDRAIAGLRSESAPDELRRRILDPGSARVRAGRRSWVIPERFRWPALTVAAAAAVVIAVVASTLPWQSRGSDRPDVAVVSPSPGGPATTSDPGATVGPPPSARPPILAYAPLAELTPGDATGSVVALDSDFRLASLDGTPPAELAARVTVEPALEFAIEPEADAMSVRLRPLERLTPGAVYRFTLAGNDGRTLDTWAFQARQSVRIVSTVPGDTATDVPLDTGIEITFDQDGVVDPASHVTIEPATKGRFEQHGRVLAFVPNRLKPATIYTVTVSSGVTVKGTDEVLAEDVRFRFETAAKAGNERAVVLQFADDVVEVATATRPELTMWAYSQDESAPPRTAQIEVYRLADLGSAIDAFRELRRSSRWAQWSTDDLVPTAGLRRVMAFDARLEQADGTLWFRFPEVLPPGSYLVQHPSPTRPVQTVLQVTDVAGYLTVSDPRTLVWANDIATGGALSGATVTADGDALGRTDADGLLLADTPATLRIDPDRRCTEACDPVVIVTAADGRSAFLPAAGPRDGDGKGGGYGWSDRDEDYWLLFHTDRTLYRRTDTVNVWGVIRDRESGAVPATIDIHLLADSGGPAPPPIVTLHPRPGPTGAFTGSLRLADLPEGSYQLALRVGSKVVGTTGIQVDRILKPAYRIEVETGRRVYIEGDRIKITARANFFEGSPVPGVPLRIGGYVERGLTTTRDGTAVHRTVARVDGDNDESGMPTYQSVSVGPARAEEGEIFGASREFIVFPSTRTIDAQSTIRGGRVRAEGAVHLVDRDRLETELAAGGSPWDLDVRGIPVGGATVTVRFIEQIPIKRQVGTEYDFIEKKVVPIYQYETRSRDAGTVKVRTAPDGAFTASVPDSGEKRDYRITLSVGDPDGHTARLVTYASGEGSIAQSSEWASLTPTDSTADHPDGYGVGDRIDLTMRESRAVRSGSRYLFQVAQRGVREATVQSSPRLVTRFETWAVPNVSITAVRFTGNAYVEGGEYYVSYRSADRDVQVALSTTRPRYAPGDEVKLEVETRDSAGKPVASTVILQAVDEKLFSIGAAAEADPLRELYASVSGGIRTQYASHRARRQGFEGGDTAGGGGDERYDFRDALLFEAIDTGPDGRATTTFRLSDDLTSWRVSAAAITADLQAGGGSIQVPVGLPFFVDASIAPEYLVGDRPSIQVRAYGSALAPGSDVRISVEFDSPGLAPVEISAKAFESVTVPLPRLTAGLHKLTIAARSGSGASVLRDRLTRAIVVVESRLDRTRTAFVDLAVAGPLLGGEGLTTVVISDASAGRYLPMLLDVAANDGARLERALAAAISTSLLAGRYGAPDGIGAVADFDGDRYQTPDGGVAVVPYASSDLELSGLVAIVAPERFDAGRLQGYLEGVLANPKETRERRMYALAGLAGVGAPVLPKIQAAAADDEMTVRERLIIGLAAAALGDAASARSIAVSLLESHGERLGEQARLRAGDSASDITAATALMAMLAAATGDPIAPALWAYVEGNPSGEAPHELHAVGFVARLLDRLPVQPASFAYEIDGKRTVVELDTGEVLQLTLTANQLAGLTIERLEGEIGVTTTWREPVATTAFERDPDVEIRRSRTPIGTITTGDLVRIDLTVTFGPKAPAGCHQVTEFVPSGLVALGSHASWLQDEDDAVRSDLSMPYAQTGQLVYFCAEPTSRQRTVRLRYYARVITPGTYIWEPAIVESRTDPDRAALTPMGNVTIR